MGQPVLTRCTEASCMFLARKGPLMGERAGVVPEAGVGKITFWLFVVLHTGGVMVRAESICQSAGADCGSGLRHRCCHKLALGRPYLY